MEMADTFDACFSVQNATLSGNIHQAGFIHIYAISSKDEHRISLAGGELPMWNNLLVRRNFRARRVAQIA